MRNAQGWRLEGVRVPGDAVSVFVREDGRVTAKLQNGERSCGRIRLATFAAPERLDALGGTLFAAPRAAGGPHLITLGRGEEPKVRFGMLEQSKRFNR